MGDPGLDTGISQYFGHEIQSESTLPLLSYLLKSRQLEDETLVDIFHNVKAGVGTDERPIPDEAVIIEKEMINIINNGPQGGRLEGKPKVRSSSTYLFSPKLTIFRSPLLELAPQASALDTSSRKLDSMSPYWKLRREWVDVSKPFEIRLLHQDFMERAVL